MWRFRHAVFVMSTNVCYGIRCLYHYDDTARPPLLLRLRASSRYYCNTVHCLSILSRFSFMCPQNDRNTCVLCVLLLSTRVTWALAVALAHLVSLCSNQIELASPHLAAILSPICAQVSTVFWSRFVPAHSSDLSLCTPRHFTSNHISPHSEPAHSPRRLLAICCSSSVCMQYWFYSDFQYCSAYWNNCCASVCCVLSLFFEHLYFVRLCHWLHPKSNVDITVEPMRAHKDITDTNNSTIPASCSVQQPFSTCLRACLSFSRAVEHIVLVSIKDWCCTFIAAMLLSPGFCNSLEIHSRLFLHIPLVVVFSAGQHPSRSLHWVIPPTRPLTYREHLVTLCAHN